MEYVKPITDTEVIDMLKHELKKQSSRNYLLFVMGINTGLRISELLSVLVKDAYEENGEPKSFLSLSKQDVYLNGKVKQALEWHYENERPALEQYLFQSSRKHTAISRQQAYRVMNQAAVNARLKEKIGPHTLRKTFGYHAYKKGIALSLIQKRFFHSTPAETLRYIGINKEEVKPHLDVHL
ncbi:Phage integrase family protein [Alteribacillus persepolensis]|uniref:Phage integrase family protein n=1 Tax=Alteribacillus persepolensis TaxID=568899 RepID=A0A1G8FLY1_9BACI|nr:tyrosine-type recombinase/integrase [Alteribacillus persepolensis]SDH83079.1 Phage integrase family protein [Alteribacillus persepolensis]